MQRSPTEHCMRWACGRRVSQRVITFVLMFAMHWPVLVAEDV